MRKPNLIKLFGLIGLLLAQTCAATPPGYKFVRNNHSYTVNSDGSFSLLMDIEVKVLKEDAVKENRQQEITYSTSVEKVDIIEAYTRKQDGKRIDVPKSNYQLEVNSGKDQGSPAFSDRTTLTLIFPEVAVGDCIHWLYKINQTEPLFPGHFSEWRVFPKYYLYDEVNISIDLPDAMPARYELAGFTEKPAIKGKDRKTLRWTYRNEKSDPGKDDWGEIDYFGKDPGYIISTFRSHAEIAGAYGVRARQKAVVTDRIRVLADEITRGKTTPYDQAHALYDWVAKNIGYAGNCIGVGAVVPRDTDFVLDNRMGDCKDHATLLEALLTAKNIPSTQALINSGSMYALPNIPVVAMVNHVLNYLPSLDLYADATAEHTPFGLLPERELGKPILLVEGHRDGLKTPNPSGDTDAVTTHAEITIGKDGAAKGQVSWVNRGRQGLFSNMPAALEKYREFKNDKERVEDYSKSMIKKYGFEGGTVNYSLDEHPKSADVSTATMDFDVKGYLNGGSLGAFDIGPVFSSSQIFSTLRSIRSKEVPSSDFYCKGDHIEESYVYHFPDNLKILAVPDNIEFAGPLVFFSATYALNGNTLTVRRRIDDFTVGPVCKPGVYRSYREVAEKVLPNLKSQVVYKYVNL